MVLPYKTYNIDEVGAKNIPELEDVVLTNLAEGQALIYDSTLEAFTNQDVLTGSSSTAIDDEVLKKDSSDNIVGADIISTASTVGTLTKQKTIFANSTPPFAIPLSSIESINNNGVYSMNLKPDEGNPIQKGMTLKALSNDTLVGINTDAPVEGLHLLGNFRIDNNTTQQIRFYNIQGSTKEAGTIKVDDNGGGADMLFLTRPSGGIEPTEKMIIDKTGNVGIGTSTPSQKLDVNGTIRGSNLITDGYLDLNPDGGLSFNAQLRHDNFYPNAKPDQIKMFLRNHSFWALQDGTDTGNGGDGTRKMVIDARLDVNGDIYYNGVLLTTSDDRLKSYETDVSGATDMILKLKPKFYKKHPTLITDDPTPDLSDVLHYDEYGFIAQDLNEEPKLSHFVRENPETKIYNVNYIEMIPLLVQTIKELNERIKVLESRT
jgi:hypothetical protein